MASDATGQATDPQDQGSKTPWPLILAGIGLVVALIALGFAISAKNATVDDAQITKIVAAQNAQQGADLEQSVAAANDVLARLEASQAVARRTRVQLAKAAKANESGVADNTADITTLQDQVSKLQSQVSDLTKQVSENTTDITTLTTNQQALTTQVDALDNP